LHAAPAVVHWVFRAGVFDVGAAAVALDLHRTLTQVQGLTNNQVAFTLGIAEYTTKNHIKNILGKLGVGDRTQAATATIQ